MGTEALLGSQAMMGMMSHLTAGFTGLLDATSIGGAAKKEEAQARAAAGLQAGRIREHGRDVMASQTAATAASGLSVESGSPVLARLDTLRKSEEDAMIARWKGDVQATEIEGQAAVRKSQGYTTFLSGLLGATESGVKWGVKKDILKKRGDDTLPDSAWSW